MVQPSSGPAMIIVLPRYLRTAVVDPGTLRPLVVKDTYGYTVELSSAAAA
jgi:hypothetical protein